MEPKIVIKLILLVIAIIVIVAMSAGKKKQAPPVAERPRRRPPAPGPTSNSSETSGAAAGTSRLAEPKESLRTRLEAWLTTPDPTFDDDLRLATLADVATLRRFIERLLAKPDPVPSPVAKLILKLAHQIDDHEVLMACDKDLVPALAQLSCRTAPDEFESLSPFPLVVAKWFAALGTPTGGMAIAKLTQDAKWQDHWMWQQVFASIPADGVGSAMLAKHIGKTIPQGFCGVAFLDWCNQLARERDDLTPHPFAAPDGIRCLEHWLNDAEHPSYAHSAAAAVAFIEASDRVRLLPLIFSHPIPVVRIEGGYSQAKAGDPAGLQVLIDGCHELAHAKRVMAYLTELGQDALIPAAAQEPEFRACAEFCDWSMHPNEMQSPPDRVHVRYRKELFWPPQHRRVEVFLVAYEYDNLFDKGPVRGVALVGPITFALIGIDGLADESDADILGRYCSWELNGHHDERRPQGDDDVVLFGRQVLASYNPDAGFLHEGESLRSEYDFAGGTPGSDFTDSEASRPGRLTIDPDLLRIWHSDCSDGAEVSPAIQNLYGIDKPAELREKIAQHMLYGDAQPAVVINEKPLVIAVKTDELDCAVLLWCPADHAAYLRKHRGLQLQAGARLVAVNTYYVEDIGQKDILPGPKTYGRYAGVWPIIGDFVSADDEALARIRARIADEEWESTVTLAKRLIAERGWMVRSVRPLLSVLGGKQVTLEQLDE